MSSPPIFDTSTGTRDGDTGAEGGDTSADRPEESRVSTRFRRVDHFENIENMDDPQQKVLTDKLLALLAAQTQSGPTPTDVSSSPLRKRIIVAVGGIPGSGKSTLCAAVAASINSALQTPTAIVVAMDGFHLTKAQLGLSEQPALYWARRGAHFTFNGHALLALVKQLAEPYSPTSPAITAPSFDHALGDPVPHDISVEPCHQVVLLEGLYVLVETLSPWKDIRALCTVEHWVDVDLDVARERVAKRHLQAGLVKSLEEGRARWENNDFLNAQFVLKSRKHAAEKKRAGEI
ncbi:hypothetical protein PhCBS80983_g05869 [Powellomyces hirtus]|uniref:Phosphoribulokinase/uridine kinase domain-containing protein n=1 Tax=Powellomyces hirtus TaxID=109895 RepID=A0A507DTR0_9FUNG|nr:hypothetical protein PhCBS80983_g05869 [Powellomyces hirtus]